MQQHLNGIAPGAALKDFTMPDPQDLETPFYLEYRYVLPDYAVKAGTLRIFQFPDRERTFPEVSLETRRYPLAYTTSEALTRRITLELPDTFEVAELPMDTDLENAHVTYRERFEGSGNTIALTIEFERRSQRVTVPEYKAYRKVLQRVEESVKRPVYLELASAQQTETRQ
jgi:hypothetical protein